MKHDAAHYEAMAQGVMDELEVADDVNRVREVLAESQVYATLAVAAATLEASRTVYPANHPLAQETT